MSYSQKSNSGNGMPPKTAPTGHKPLGKNPPPSACSSTSSSASKKTNFSKKPMIPPRPSLFRATFDFSNRNSEGRQIELQIRPGENRRHALLRKYLDGPLSVDDRLFINSNLNAPTGSEATNPGNYAIMRPAGLDRDMALKAYKFGFQFGCMLPLIENSLISLGSPSRKKLSSPKISPRPEIQSHSELSKDKDMNQSKTDFECRDSDHTLESFVDQHFDFNEMLTSQRKSLMSEGRKRLADYNFESEPGIGFVEEWPAGVPRSARLMQTSRNVTRLTMRSSTRPRVDRQPINGDSDRLDKSDAQSARRSKGHVKGNASGSVASVIPSGGIQDKLKATFDRLSKPKGTEPRSQVVREKFKIRGRSTSSRKLSGDLPGVQKRSSSLNVKVGMKSFSALRQRSNSGPTTKSQTQNQPIDQAKILANAAKRLVLGPYLPKPKPKGKSFSGLKLPMESKSYLDACIAARGKFFCVPYAYYNSGFLNARTTTSFAAASAMRDQINYMESQNNQQFMPLLKSRGPNANNLEQIRPSVKKPIPEKSVPAKGPIAKSKAPAKKVSAKNPAPAKKPIKKPMGENPAPAKEPVIKKSDTEKEAPAKKPDNDLPILQDLSMAIARIHVSRSDEPPEEPIKVKQATKIAWKLKPRKIDLVTDVYVPPSYSPFNPKAGFFEPVIPRLRGVTPEKMDMTARILANIDGNLIRKKREQIHEYDSNIKQQIMDFIRSTADYEMVEIA